MDALFMCPLLFLGSLNNPGLEPRLFALSPLDLALCLPLIWRRRWPRAVFAFIALVCFAQWLGQVTTGASDLAVLVALYTVAAGCSFRWGLAAVCGRILTKLGLRDRVQTVVYAYETGLIKSGQTDYEE
jgi:hypothetical protein